MPRKLQLLVKWKHCLFCYKCYPSLKNSHVTLYFKQCFMNHKKFKRENFKPHFNLPFCKIPHHIFILGLIICHILTFHHPLGSVFRGCLITGEFFSTFLVTFLVNFTLFNLNSWELKLFSGCSLKIYINESLATNRNVFKLTSLHPGLSISSWLLAWSGWPALTGFNITLSPMTTYRRGHCMFQSI